MSIKSSSNDSLRPPFLTHSNTSLHNIYSCYYSTVGSHIFTAFTFTNILLLLPFSILVLHLGFQRWRRQRCGSAVTTRSHSDIFTYHMVAMELISFLGSSVYCCGIYMPDIRMMLVGLHIFSIIFPGHMLFHSLTCIERYLAVVHPITYLDLRKPRGIRLRNISIGCVWLLSFGWMGAVSLYTPDFPTTLFFCVLVFSLVVTSFCSLSVLRVLIRPRPGEVGGNRECVDPSKQRAFYTITGIMGVLFVRFIGFLICVGIYSSGLIGIENECVLLSGFWFGLPSNLVLPLLFLRRTGKLVCCKNKAESG